MGKLIFGAAAMALLSGGCATAARAQDAGNASSGNPQAAPGGGPRNVTIYFSARDSKGKIVTDLKIDELKLSVDGVSQNIGTFLVPDGAPPLTFDLLLDVSGSRESHLPGIEQKYGYTFFTTLLRAGDLAYVREFSDTSKLLAIASGEPTLLTQAVAHESAPYHRTALLQAIYEACTDDLATGQSRKAILLITDGGENHSKVSEDVVEKCLRKENVTVFTVGLFDPFSVRPRTAEEMNGPDLADEFAFHTGGAVWPVTDEKDFMDALASAVEQIRGQYTIGFAGPAPKPNGKPRKLELKTSRKGITLAWPENMPDGEPIGR